MLKYLALAGAFLCALTINAEARQRHKTYLAHPDCNVLWPCADVAPSVRGERIVRSMGGFGAAQKVYTPRVSHARVKPGHRVAESYGAPSPSIGYTIARPARYIAGRLVCAVNVGAALAERGIKGTGSALAKSYDRWGHSSVPVPGAVAVSDRRGGGHVAIVSRVEGGRVFVWNATGGRRGWREIEYTNRRARYRVAG